MGASKREYFNSEQNSMATLAKALGHPARIAIIEFLLENDQANCSYLVNELPLSQPTISQHLTELRNAGLISGVFENNSIYYSVNHSPLRILQEYITQIDTGEMTPLST